MRSVGRLKKKKSHGRVPSTVLAELEKDEKRQSNSLFSKVGSSGKKMSQQSSAKRSPTS